MKNETAEKLLRAMEQQNLAELSDDTPHRFSRGFDKKALAVCRGRDTENTDSRRTVPLWAFVLVAVLLAATVTGCALAYFLPRAVPFFGVVDFESDRVIYSTTEPLVFDGLSVETVLFMRDGDGGELLMWAHSDTDVPYAFFADSTSVADITVDGVTYPLMCERKEKTENGYAVIARAHNVPAGTASRITVTHGGESRTVTLEDISRRGYEVSEWAEIDGMTVKLLPLYTNGRILTMTVEGADEATIRVEALIYDDLGNCIKASGGELVTCEEPLAGEVVRIEITALHVSRALPEPTVTVPLTDDPLPALALIDTPIFTERITEVRKTGIHWGIHTERVPKSDNYTDISATYTFEELRNLHTYTDGAQSFAYMLEETQSTEVTVIAKRYSYTIRSRDGAPLGVIEIEKR